MRIGEKQGEYLIIGENGGKYVRIGNNMIE